MSDIHTVAVGSLIALDPERPIREADITCLHGEAPAEQEILRAMKGAMRQQGSRGPDPRTCAGLDRLTMALARRLRLMTRHVLEPHPEINGCRQDGERARDPGEHRHDRLKPEPEAKLRQDETGKHELGKGIGLAYEEAERR